MYKPQFRITPLLLQHITDASDLRSWIVESIINVPWLSQLQADTVTQLAHSSTSIEGNPLTLAEVESLSRGDEVQQEERAKREVVNHLAATRWIWKRKPEAIISEKGLLHLHRLLTQGVLPREQIGRYKTKINRVVDSQGITVYTPPGPIKVRALTLDLLKWIATESAPLHPIIVSAICHHHLVSIHPFADGNGRISRGLGIWILFVRGFDTHHLFALDEFFSTRRKLYYDKIQQARDLDDDLTHWLEYVALGVCETLARTRRRIESLQVSSVAHSITITKKQEELLHFLRATGRVTTTDLQKRFKITRARVAQIVKPLLDAGLILRDGQTRSTSYRFPSRRKK